MMEHATTFHLVCSRCGQNITHGPYPAFQLIGSSPWEVSANCLDSIRGCPHGVLPGVLHTMLLPAPTGPGPNQCGVCWQSCSQFGCSHLGAARFPRHTAVAPPPPALSLETLLQVGGNFIWIAPNPACRALAPSPSSLPPTPYVALELI